MVDYESDEDGGVYWFDTGSRPNFDLVIALRNAAPDLIKCARALQEIANHNHSACAEMDSLTERDCLRMIVESAKAALSAGQTGGKDAQ